MTPARSIGIFNLHDVLQPATSDLLPPTSAQPSPVLRGHTPDAFEPQQQVHSCITKQDGAHRYVREELQSCRVAPPRCPEGLRCRQIPPRRRSNSAESLQTSSS